MMRWFWPVRSSFSKGAKQSRGRKRRWPSRALQVEALEDRLAPSILIPITTHRDLVYDASRQVLYITSSDGTVQRYDVTHQTLLSAWTVGTSLNGADISPDGSSLYVGENSLAAGTVLHKVNLADGSVQNLSYTGTIGEYGSWEVAISSNGTGFVTTRFNGGGGVYLHQLNLATNTLSNRTDEPNVNGTIEQDTQVHRGADRSLLFFTQGGSGVPYFNYDPSTNTFPNSANSTDYQWNMLSAVSRDGSLIAEEPTDSVAGGVMIRDRHLNLVKTLLADDGGGSGLDGGLAFDPTQNILYVADSYNSQIYAYDTTNWNRLFRLYIGETIPRSRTLGNGVMVVSPDSHWLFMSTPSGVRMFDLTAGPQLSINDVTVNDNGFETTNAQFTATLSRINQQPVTVNYATADGTAIGVQDYVRTSGTLEFLPNVWPPPPTGFALALTQTVTVPVIGSGVTENETFSVNLSAASNAQISKAQGTGTIQNSVTYTAVAGINDISVVENSPTTTNAVFTVALTAAVPAGQSYTVNYATANGSAIAGVDYTATSGTLTFNPGQTAQTISVPVTGGVQHTQDVTFEVNISSSNASIIIPQGHATIVANSAPTSVPTISINDVSVAKGDYKTYAVFTLSLSAPSTQGIDVDCATADQSQLFSLQEVDSFAQTVGFQPGVTSQTFSVPIRGNDIVEPNVTFLVNLKNATNALIARAQGVGTVVNDTVAQLSIDNVRVAEASLGTANATFTITLSGIIYQPVTVNYATSDGTATAGTDYQPVSGTLTFEAGQTSSETISVPINSDSTPEGDKNFFVTLSGAVNATITNATGTGTILSDIPPALQAPNITVQKPASGTQNAVFTVTLPTTSHRTVTVAYTTVDGTAKAGIDYQATSGTLTFAPGVVSQTVSVPIFGNTLSQPDKSFTLQLTNTTAPGGAAMVNDPFPIGPNTGPGAPVFFNNALYMSANDGVSGNELWKFDGTNFTQVADINPGPNSSNPGEFGWGIYNGALYFSADSGVDGPQLWKYDGTTVSQVADIHNFGNGSWPGNFMIFNGKLYFTATSYPDGQQIWSTDGTTTTEVTNINPGGFNPTLLGVVGNQLVFSATTAAYGRELWEYDGTTASLVADIMPGAQGSNPFGMAIYNGALYFRASDSTVTQELFKYDGTSVTFVASINKVNNYGANPTQMTVFGNFLYFTATDESHGSELWRYDGTTALMVQDAVPGPAGLFPGGISSVGYPLAQSYAAYDGSLYFDGNDGNTGDELWKYDGTEITQAADINPGLFGSNPNNAVVFNGSLYFLANDGVHGMKLWTYLEPFVAANSQATCTIHSAASASQLVVSGFPSPTTAGVAGSFTVTAEDSNGNVVTGYTGTVHFTSSDGQAVLPADYTFVAADAGVHTFSATLKTAGNSQSITATDTVTSTITGSQTGITVNPAAASMLVVSGFPSPVISGQAQNFSVKALDPYGNTATGYTGKVHFTSSDGAAALPADYTFLGSDAGMHTFSATLETAGTQSLTATDTVMASITGMEASILVKPASFLVSGFPSPTTAGAAHNFSVTAKNSNGTTASGYTGTVHFTSTDGQAVLPADYTFVSADAGVHTFSAALKTAGSQSLTATDSIVSSVTGAQSGITVNAAALSKLAVTGFPSPTVAGVAHSFTVTAQDAYGNTVSSYLDTVVFSSTDKHAVLPASYTFTSTDAGVHNFSATLKTAGTQTITAKDKVHTTITGSESIVVNAAAATHLTVSVPASSTAGAAFSITVTALDTFGNIATGYTGTVHFTSSDTKAVLPANYTFTGTDAGVHVFSNGVTLKTAGSQTVTATDAVTATITGKSSTIKVSAAALDHFKIAAPTSSTAGTAFSITVTAQDAYNNTVTTYTGTIHFTSSDSQAVLPANYTFTSTAKGVHTFSGVILKTAGTQTITAKDTVTTTVTGTASVNVAAAKASKLRISAPASVTHGVSFTFTVTVVDAFGNVATGYTGTVHFTSSDAAASLPANYKFTTTDAGVHTFSATLNTTGSQSLTATDTVTASITGTDPAIQVV